MNKSDSIQNLAAALCKFQQEVTNPKHSADNPFYKSKYTPLHDIINHVRPILAKHGLSVFQNPAGDGDRVVITTLLMHTSGEWIETDPLVMKAEKITPQGAGAVITYGRRYSLSAVLGIASEDDDDGNSAEGKAPAKQPDSPKQEPKQSEPPRQQGQLAAVISAAQARRIYALSNGNEDLCKTVIGRHGFKSSAEVTKDKYEAICSEIQKAVSA